MNEKPILGHVDVTFLEENALSQNGRLYLPEAVESAVASAQADLAANRPITVFATHADGLADDASKMAGLVTKVWREGTRARARIGLFATESGRNIAAVLKGGGLRTCSLRSNDFGTGAPREVGGKTVETISRLRLAGIDWTMVPGLAVAGVDALALESQGAGRRLWESMEVVVQDVDLPLAEATKKEADGNHGASDYAYVPDKNKPSTWKLRIDTAKNVAGAAAAFSTGGFRGKRVQIPAGAVAAVKRKVRAAWKKFYPDKAADEMPASLKESTATEAIYVEISDWEPCQDCRDGNDDACACPGCANDGECWCCAVLDADDDDDDTVEGDMTKDEIEKLISEGVAAALASARTEAIHTHVHEHEGMDGDSYSHEHSHRHEGTADHDDPSAHLHGHGVTWEALLHVPPKRLAEALTTVLKQQSAGLQESGRTLSAATLGKLASLREAAHSGVCEALDTLMGGEGKEGVAESTAKLQASLTESLDKQKTLTEENAELTRKLTEAQEALKAATAKAETLTDVLGKDWRPQRKVPVESLLGTESTPGGDRELSGKEMVSLYAHGLAARIGAK